jgi:hypothetical protein
MWIRLKNRNMYDTWSNIFVPDPRKVPSLLNSAVQHKFLHRIFDGAELATTNRRVYVAVTDINTYLPKLIPNADPCFIDAIVASSAFPLVYPPVKLNDTYYIDGAFNFTAPVHEIIDLCREATINDTGSPPTAIHVDLILPHGNFDSELNMPPLTETPNMFDVANRMLVKIGSSFYSNDYEYEGDPANNITTRAFLPNKPLIGNYLSFTHSRNYIRQGYVATLDQLNMD